MVGELNAIDAEVARSRFHSAQRSPSGDIARNLQRETIPFRKTWKLCVQLQRKRPEVQAHCCKVPVKSSTYRCNFELIAQPFTRGSVVIRVLHMKYACGSILMRRCIVMGSVLRCGSLAVTLP